MATDIKNYLESQALDLQTLRDSLAKATPSHTFWAGRVVTFSGEITGSIDFWTLRDKVETICKARWEKNELTLKDRKALLEMNDRFKDLRKETSAQLDKANIITRFFRCLREFDLSCGVNMRWNPLYLYPLRFTKNQLDTSFAPEAMVDVQKRGSWKDGNFDFSTHEYFLSLINN